MSSSKKNFWRTSWGDNSFTIHQRNLHKLATKMLKANNGLPVFIAENFYNFRQKLEIKLKVDLANTEK